MPTINVSATSGVVRNAGTVYSTVRNAITGSVASVGGTRTIGQQQVSTTYTIYRAYLAFDTSAITSTPGSATLNINIALTDGFDYIIEDANAPNLVTDISTGDYDAYIGSAFGIVFTPANGWNTITLDADALNLMNVNDIFKISIRSLNESTNTPPDIETQTDTLYFATNVPYIDYTLGYVNKILSMLSSTVSKVNSVTNATILRIDGTPAGGLLIYRTPTADAVNNDTSVACSYFTVDGSWVALYTTSLTLTAGLVVYTNSSLTTPYNGSGFYWGLSTDGVNNNGLYSISSVGVLGAGPSCNW